MPERTTGIQIVLARLPHQPQRDHFGDQASEGDPEHGTRGQVNRIPEPHRAHPDHQKRHTEKKAAIHQCPDDLGAVPAETPRRIRRAARNALRDDGHQNAANRRQGVKRIRQDGNRASPEPDGQFNHEVDAGEPGRNHKGLAGTRHMPGVGMTGHISSPSVSYRSFASRRREPTGR